MSAPTPRQAAAGTVGAALAGAAIALSFTGPLAAAATCLALASACGLATALAGRRHTRRTPGTPNWERATTLAAMAARDCVDILVAAAERDATGAEDAAENAMDVLRAARNALRTPPQPTPEAAAHEAAFLINLDDDGDRP